MEAPVREYLSRFLRSSWLHHVLFWLFAYFVLLSIFASENYRILDDIFNPIADSIYTIIFLFTLFCAVMVNLYIGIPLLLKKKHYGFYLLGFLAQLFLFSLLNQLLFEKWIDFILPDFYFISYYDYGDIVTFFAVFLLASTLLKLSKEWFELNESRHELIRLEKDKKEIELKALMAQINPHFLFNSLNVLYNLALKSSQETPSAIIKLSDILRYVINEAGKKKVTLRSEVDLINNYIDLQRYRTDKKSVIEFKHTGVNDGLTIAPMLFLPLVENAFKHGLKSTTGHAYIHIHLKADKSKVDFSIVNNKDPELLADKETAAGTGLKNIAGRLQLLYPAKHHFEISDAGDTFTVKLSLVLND